MTSEALYLPKGVEVLGSLDTEFNEILSHEALSFLATLQRSHNSRRLELLDARQARQVRIDKGHLPDFPAETASIRAQNWTVAPIPQPLQRRHVEITGPVDAKMVINALNSGADVFMADFEDANSPTWSNTIEGQLNLRAAVRKTLTYEHPKKGTYTLNADIAVLLVRPRGWHLEEKHILVDGQPMSASLVDFGLYFFHNAQTLLDQGRGPYFYLPKLESYLEARLWNDVFVHAQELCDVPQGSIKATVLLENILLSFEIDEVLYELREHMAGINAGRWDYIFSAIKKFRNHDTIFPDRGQITMQAPFMKAYTTRLVQTCHKRQAHAMGGMSAFIPSKDPEVNANAFEKVKADKTLESSQGFDGTWVAHPGLVGVAREAFEAVLGDRDHQKDHPGPAQEITAQDLLNFDIERGQITEAGLRLNINVGIRYIASWLNGIGAAAIHNLMEDAATAEISRSQIWQWLHHSASLADGRTLDLALYTEVVNEELAAIKQDLGADAFDAWSFPLAREIFDKVSTDKDFPDFLTLVAYDHI